MDIHYHNSQPRIHHPLRPLMPFFTTSGYLLLIAWAMTLAAQSNIATAPPYISFFWTQYVPYYIVIFGAVRSFI